MTRTELEQLRALLAETVDCQECYAIGCQECAGVAAALAILDAELAKPETREWRVTWRGGPESCAPGDPRETMAYPEQLKAENSFKQLMGMPKIYADVRIESRPPAGPWEPEKIKET